jgi:hypothetical protein
MVKTVFADFMLSGWLTVDVEFRSWGRHSVWMWVTQLRGLTVERYGLVFCGAPSLTRGWVCLFYILLILASAVFLGSESLVIRDRILLSQI